MTKKTAARIAVVRDRKIGGAAARHEAGAAAHAEAAAFGFLQQHGRDQDRDDHEMDDDNDSLHFDLPSQTKAAGLRPASGFAGFEFARCYTIGPGIVTPDGSGREIIPAGSCEGSRQCARSDQRGFTAPIFLL